ncbi:MAG: hypothetical protein ATN35_00105 [Epulopiscium sp. Nele67-Bin004]|nr:MAG: hypothetical protein ATN35_00105 [Epulopiscium sp. Nele67-Bin004]
MDRVIYLILGIYSLFFMINSLPLLSYNASAGGVGPGVMPMFLSVVLMSLSAVGIFKKSEKHTTIPLLKAGVLLVLLVCFIFIWQITNFYVALPLLILAVMNLLGIFNLKDYIILTSAFSCLLYGVFTLLLKVSL